MNTKIMNALNDILSSFGDKYYIGNELNKAKVIQDIDHYDEEIIMALLSNELVKKHYARKIGEYTLIETNKLIETFEMDNYWMDSYTKYSKKIGLTSNRRFLDESTDVVLDFPYKDTVLKAGMSKEDVEKEDLVPNEPFYNEMIASEEIDVLLDKKLLVDAQKYTLGGLENAGKFNEEDNLILKGNNLLALHSLKENYAGKVKLIYIDPPYNTKSAASTFDYNNSFNHSSWLTFMKNRVEIATEFLKESGFFVVAIDDNELFYLGVLLDEILGRENRLGVVTVVHNPGGRQDEEFFPTAHENMLIYARNKDIAKINNLPISAKKKSEYKYSDSIGNYKLRNFRRSGNNSLRRERPNLFYSIYYDEKNNILSTEFIEDSIEILPIDNNTDERCWRWSSERFNELKKSYIEIKKIKGSYQLYTKERETDYKGEKAKSVWDSSEYSGQNATHSLKKIFGEKVFTYPKSEFLIKDVISIFTDSQDLVLDFFMGSATTQAVAMKMNRRFIGIEQMDYINTVSVPRLQKVMEGEQGGISKDVNWQGGGSFVYAELMEKSKGYLESVLEAEDTDSLKQIYQLMLENVDLDFRVDLEQVQEMLNDGISLEDKKRLLVKVIDKNQLYYNYSEIDDANVRDLISDNDYAFNQSFYKEEEYHGQENQ